MKVTISDVARRAGVSIKTVSRVLNREANVTTGTRDKVLSAAKELNYSPNLSARRLASSRSFLIALLYDIPNPGYVTNIQQGATEACRACGYHLVVEPLDLTDTELQQNIEDLLRNLPVDGVILTPPLSDNGDIVSVLVRQNIPYVPVSATSRHGDVPIVKMNDVAAAREMTEYLLSLGHTDIAFVKGHPNHNSSNLRFEGFREAMRRAELPIRADWIVEGEFTYKTGVAAAETLLNRPDRPTAIFSSNDDMAAGILSGARQYGLRVPDDVSVCGFDDDPLARVVWPQLTTIKQPVEQMGFQAAQLLLPGQDKRKARDINLDHHLIIRGSTQTLVRE